MSKFICCGIGLTVSILGGSCRAYATEPQHAGFLAHPSRSLQSGSLTIRISTDGGYVLQSGSSIGSDAVSQGDVVGLYRRIRETSSTASAPSVSIRTDGSASFQSLTTVIGVMVSANISRFEVVTDTSRVMVQIPKGAPALKQSEISLLISAEGKYALGAGGKLERHDSQALAGLLQKQSTRKNLGKNCCYVLINADEDASIQAYLNAVIAIQLAGIDDYWIAASSGGTHPSKALAHIKAGEQRAPVEQIKALEQHIRALEAEQARLLKKRAKVQ